MRYLVGLLVFLGLFTGIAAQSTVPPITNTQYEIGFDCPAAQALSSDGMTLWVLMEGCLSRVSKLQAFNVADGTPIETGNSDTFSSALAVLSGHYVDDSTNPMALLEDDTVLSLYYIDAETYAPRNVLLSLSDGEILPPTLDDEDRNALFLTATEYPETTVYNYDHTQAAVIGAEFLTVFDLPTSEVIFSLPLEDEFNAYPSFSKDGTVLYVGQFDNVEDMNNYASTLSIYSLPDGELLSSYSVPSAFLSVSPDQRYATAEIGSNDGTSSDIFIVDLDSGASTDPIALYEPSRKLMACANDGRNMSDVDFTVSGILSLSGLDWLPDSSGFVYTRSYGGEGAGGGLPCAFNTSRLNRIDFGE